jgi:hypothetical protein
VSLLRRANKRRETTMINKDGMSATLDQVISKTSETKNWCERCGTLQNSSRLREPTDPTVCFDRNGKRYTRLVRASVICDPCAYALTLILY